MHNFTDYFMTDDHFKIILNLDISFRYNSFF
jgi:hypothetical protein